MLGWWITVSKGSIAEDLPQDATLASWEVGLGGLRWLDALVAAGRAQKLRGDGYSTRYEARAEFVLPLLDEVMGHPSVKLKMFPPKLDRAEIETCPPDSLLTIDAWDQS